MTAAAKRGRGRPERVPGAPGVYLTVRVTAEEMDRIEARAAEAGLSRSDYARWRLLGGRRPGTR